MFNIETAEDVKILKELTGISNDDTRLKELEDRVQQLSKENADLTILTKQQKITIDKLTKSAITADQCRNIVFDLLSNSSKPKVIKEKAKRIPTLPKPDNEEFEFQAVMRKKFHSILVEGNNLTHYTVRSQKMPLPVSTIELLAIVEVYQYRKRKLLNKDQRNICKLFGINKVQFGKIYYNLKEGVFFKALEEINNQIRGAVFRIKNGTIHIVDGSNTIDTKVDVKKFNYLLNIYVNSDQPYATIYKLSKENKDIDPIHLLLLMKKNVSVSNAITQGE